MKELAEDVDELPWTDRNGIPFPRKPMRQAKEMGFSDKYLARFWSAGRGRPRPPAEQTASRPAMGRRACQRRWNTRPTTIPPTVAQRTKFP